MLTSAQASALKAAVTASTDPIIVALRAQWPGDVAAISQALADEFNKPAAPAFIVWRTAVPVSEILANAIGWTAVDALTVGKARIWEWMSKLNQIDASKANIRQGIADCFGAASATTTQITAIAKRSATRFEQVFATGTGSTGSPATMTIEGVGTMQDFMDAFWAA